VGVVEPLPKIGGEVELRRFYEKASIRF
jgi:hypothetical protein